MRRCERRGPAASGAISIEEGGTLLVAVNSRLRLAIGEACLPGFNDTSAAVRASVRECVDALEQLHAMLGERRSIGKIIVTP